LKGLPILLIATGCLIIAARADASWLSDRTGINIDLAPALRAVVQPPSPQVAPVVIISPPIVVKTVSDADKAALIEEIAEIDRASASNAALNRRITLGLILGAIVLAATASLASFLRLSIVAGICSILTTVAIGANNTLPFREDAEKYRLVSSQTHSLLRDAKLNAAMTSEDYNSYLKKLDSLASFGDAVGGSGNTQALQDLIHQLNIADNSKTMPKS
jgi:hypothetical protein